MRFSRLTAAALLVAISPLASACADSGAKGTGAGDGAPAVTTYSIPTDDLVSKVGQATVTISSTDNTFEPKYVEVSAGTQVVFRNDGRNDHDIVPDKTGAFEGVKRDQFTPGATHIVMFDQAGDFPYFCSVHGTMKSGMNGAIRVVPKK